MYSDTMCSDLGLFWQYTMYICSLRSCNWNQTRRQRWLLEVRRMWQLRKCHFLALSFKFSEDLLDNPTLDNNKKCQTNVNMCFSPVSQIKAPACQGPPNTSQALPGKNWTSIKRETHDLTDFFFFLKIFSFLSWRSKETRKYSHLRGWNHRILPFFGKKKIN